MAKIEAALAEMWFKATVSSVKRVNVYSSDKLLLSVALDSITINYDNPEQLMLRFSSVIGLAAEEGEAAVAQLVDEQDQPLITVTVSNSTRAGEMSLNKLDPSLDAQPYMFKKGYPYSLKGIEFGFSPL